MNYHTPHPLWAQIGCPDFETFEKRFVLKGNFPPSVHTDVVEEFTIAEYQMAHSYYHYPMFDEGFSKLLRIIEMAVKLRCKELGITLHSNITNNKTSKQRTLNELMNDLALAEPAKNLSMDESVKGGVTLFGIYDQRIFLLTQGGSRLLLILRLLFHLA